MPRPKRDVSASVQRLDAVQSAEASSGEETIVSRPKMPPVISTRLKLAVPGLDQDNYYHRWCNDVDNNIPNRLEEGYEFVVRKGHQAGERTADYSQATSSLYVKSVGQGMKAYLMRIPKDWHKERQAQMSQRDADEREHYIKERVKSEKGFYGSVSIKDRNR